MTEWEAHSGNIPAQILQELGIIGTLYSSLPPISHPQTVVG